MPLARFEVRNEYGLGLPDLYKHVDRDDPKAILDATSVAGLVGILRQLGDLAEYDYLVSSPLFLLTALFYSIFLGAFVHV